MAVIDEEQQRRGAWSDVAARNQADPRFAPNLRDTYSRVNERLVQQQQGGASMAGLLGGLARGAGEVIGAGVRDVGRGVVAAGERVRRAPGEFVAGATAPSTPAPRTGAPAAPVDNFGTGESIRASDRQAAETFGANQRARQGVTERKVPGAPGVVRMDVPGRTPLYTNVPEDPWNMTRQGGTVSTIPAANFMGRSPSDSAAISAARFAAAERGDFDAVRRSYQQGGGSWMGVDAAQQRVLDTDAQMERMLQSRSRSDRQQAAEYFRTRQAGRDALAAQEAQAAGVVGAKQAEMEANAPQRAAELARTQAQALKTMAELEEATGLRARGYIEPNEFGVLTPEAQAFNERLTEETSALNKYLATTGLSAADLYRPRPPQLNERDWTDAQEALKFVMDPAQSFRGGYGSSQGVRAFANGGVVTPPTPQNPAQQQYAMYASTAMQNQIQPLPFEEFAKLMERTRSGMTQTPTIATAGGGMVPGQDSIDVSGRSVVDPDPNAPTDSIPAVIDGQQPAALDSGEFVIPKDVVMYHGLARLKKLIAEARQSEGA